MIEVRIDGRRQRLARKGEPISLADELAALRREAHDTLSKAEYEFSKVDRVCSAFSRQVAQGDSSDMRSFR